MDRQLPHECRVRTRVQRILAAPGRDDAVSLRRGDGEDAATAVLTAAPRHGLLLSGGPGPGPLLRRRRGRSDADGSERQPGNAAALEERLALHARARDRDRDPEPRWLSRRRAGAALQL